MTGLVTTISGCETEPLITNTQAFTHTHTYMYVHLEERSIKCATVKEWRAVVKEHISDFSRRAYVR